MPLEQALRVGQGPLLLDAAGDGDQEDLRFYLSGWWAVGVGLPEHSALGLEDVADDQPVEGTQPRPLEPGVETARGRVLAEQEVTRHLAPGHPVHGGRVRIVAIEPGQ